MSSRLDGYTGQQPQRDTLVNINSTTSYPPPQWPKKPSHALPRRLSPLPPANQFVHPHLLSTLFLPHTHSLSIHRTNTQQTDAQGQLTAAVDDLLDQLQHKFDNVSRDMFGKRQLSPLHCSSILVGPIHNASKKTQKLHPAFIFCSRSYPRSSSGIQLTVTVDDMARRLDELEASLTIAGDTASPGAGSPKK